MAEEFRRMMQLRGVTAEWAGSAEVLLVGELAIEFGQGRTRLKSGNGTDAFPALPYIGEQDDTARGQIQAQAAGQAALDQRVTAVELLAPRVASTEAGVAANAAAVAGKQDRLPGQNLTPGDLLTWTGQAWGTTALTPLDGTLIRWDGQASRWAALPAGAPGAVLAVLNTGQVGWRPQSGVTVRTLVGGAEATVEAAFNALRPDVSASDLMMIQWKGAVYLYGGPPGLAINTATAGQFTQIGAAVPWASAADFTTPPGGSTTVAVTPATLIAWSAGQEIDAGTY